MEERGIQATCSICLFNLIKPSMGGIFTILDDKRECRHVFHTSCLRTVIDISGQRLSGDRRQGEKVCSCPKCRKIFLIKNNSFPGIEIYVDGSDDEARITETAIAELKDKIKIQDESLLKIQQEKGVMLGKVRDLETSLQSVTETLGIKERERLHTLKQLQEFETTNRDMKIKLALAGKHGDNVLKDMKSFSRMLKNPISNKTLLSYEELIKKDVEQARRESLRHEVVSGAKICSVSLGRAISDEPIIIDDEDEEGQLN